MKRQKEMLLVKMMMLLLSRSNNKKYKRPKKVRTKKAIRRKKPRKEKPRMRPIRTSRLLSRNRSALISCWLRMMIKKCLIRLIFMSGRIRWQGILLTR